MEASNERLIIPSDISGLVWMVERSLANLNITPMEPYLTYSQQLNTFNRWRDKFAVFIWYTNETQGARPQHLHDKIMYLKDAYNLQQGVKAQTENYMDYELRETVYQQQKKINEIHAMVQWYQKRSHILDTMFAQECWAKEICQTKELYQLCGNTYREYAVVEPYLLYVGDPSVEELRNPGTFNLARGRSKPTYYLDDSQLTVQMHQYF